MMHILSVATTHPRYNNDSEPAFILNLNRALVKKGYTITTILPHAYGAQCEEIVDGIQIKRFYYFWPFRAQNLCYNGGILSNLRHGFMAKLNLPFFLVSMMFTLIYQLLRKKYDCIHCHWFIPQGFICSCLGKLFSIPVIVSGHGSDVFTNVPFFIFFNTITARMASQLTANSIATKEAINALGCNRKISVIPMGVDLERFYKKKLGDIDNKVSERSFRLLCVGRFSETKGISFLLDMIYLAKKQNEDIILSLIGFGTELANIKDKIVSQNIDDKVKLIGKVSGDDIPRYMRAADALILPSIGHEGLGVVLLEAMACGTPVIGTNVGGIPYIIKHNKTGIIIEKADPVLMLNAVLSLKNNDILSCRLAKSGSEFVRNRYGWDNIAEHFSTLFIECDNIIL